MAASKYRSRNQREGTFRERVLGVLNRDGFLRLPLGDWKFEVGDPELQNSWEMDIKTIPLTITVSREGVTVSQPKIDEHLITLPISFDFDLYEKNRLNGPEIQKMVDRHFTVAPIPEELASSSAAEQEHLLRAFTENWSAIVNGKKEQDDQKTQDQ